MAMSVVDAAKLLLELVELQSFARDAAQLLSADAMEKLTFELATLRRLGTIIPGTGGLRKFRWGTEGKGKRGGVRVIYYYGGDHMPIFLIAMYSKSEKADLSAAEKKQAVGLVREVNRAYPAPASEATKL